MKYSSRSLFIAAGFGAVAMLFLTLGVFAGGVLFNSSFTDNAQAAAVPPAQVAAEDLVAAYEQNLIDVYNDTLPSVVNIRVTRNIANTGFELPEGFEENFPELDPDALPDEQPDFFGQGGGSGFVWDTEGHIVTNHHVIEDAVEIEVIFADDTIFEAELIGSDPDSDLAVIKIDAPASDLTTVTLGDSDALQVGQLAIAVGNPFGQDFTMTSGIISGVGRTIRGGNSGFSIPEVIQTDAPINPGNSGGPLFNRQGEVLGVNSQIISRSGANSGIGFAVPINIAKDVIPTLIDGEEVEYAWLGISGGTVGTDVAEFRNIEPGGVLVIGVAEDGPAEEGGLNGRDESLDRDDDAFLYGGDIITAIDGQSLNDMNDLITYLGGTSPGDVVTLDVIQADGTETQLEIELGVRPSLN